MSPENTHKLMGYGGLILGVILEYMVCVWQSSATNIHAGTHTLLHHITGQNLEFPTCCIEGYWRNAMHLQEMCLHLAATTLTSQQSNIIHVPSLEGYTQT